MQSHPHNTRPPPSPPSQYSIYSAEELRLAALSASNAEQLEQLQAGSGSTTRSRTTVGIGETVRNRDTVVCATNSQPHAHKPHSRPQKPKKHIPKTHVHKNALGLLSKEMARLNSEAEERFRALANEVLLQNSKALTERSRSGLAEVLEPMKENLEQFKATFIERYDREARDRFSLSDRIRELVELNHSIGLETRKLTNALKGNAKVQGDWGNDTRQHPRTLRIPPRTRLPGAGNRSLPKRRLASATDVVINYTEGRKIIIDSKVSIQSYLGMLDATDDDRRQTLAKAHVASVKKHITELRNKSYQDFVGSDRVDFVLMFIPPWKEHTSPQ